VVSEQPVQNDGTKLLQIRFYPVETTEYVGPGYIVVDKKTVPPTDEEFSFNITSDDSYSKDFTLTDAADPWDSGRIQPGTYYITEYDVPGWPLDNNVEIRDPDEESYWDVGEQKAVIDLDPGEVIVVIFTNTESEP